MLSAGLLGTLVLLDSHHKKSNAFWISISCFWIGMSFIFFWLLEHYLL